MAQGPYFACLIHDVDPNLKRKKSDDARNTPPNSIGMCAQQETIKTAIETITHQQ
jgi:hypothetical protein